jgi:hypothetical protein
MVYCSGAVAPHRETNSRAKASELIRALNHSIRRAVLRALLESGSASSTQIRALIPSVGGNNLNFHLDILVTSGAIAKEKRVGCRENFFVPTKALQVSWLLTALHLTAVED